MTQCQKKKLYLSIFWSKDKRKKTYKILKSIKQNYYMSL